MAARCYTRNSLGDKGVCNYRQEEVVASSCFAQTIADGRGLSKLDFETEVITVLQQGT